MTDGKTPRRRRKGPTLGVGTTGYGPYSRASSPRAYCAWLGMMDQCYNPRSPKHAAAAARGVAVCGEWLDFQNFAAWYEANTYDCPLPLAFTRLLDHEPLFSPETCRIVPRELLAAATVSARGHGGLPGGVFRTSGTPRSRATRYRSISTSRGEHRKGVPRDLPEEARADYLEARAGLLESEAARLDAYLTDDGRAAAARRCAQLRAQAELERRKAEERRNAE